MRETKRVEINHIDGRALYAMFIAGAYRIISNHEKLNSINVFPVPYRHTGTNLANTVRTVIDRVNSRGHFNIAIKEISEAILEGARGNSGVKFA